MSTSVLTHYINFIDDIVLISQVTVNFLTFYYSKPMASVSLGFVLGLGFRIEKEKSRDLA